MELTEDEHELYDRQIRLWGLESQNRLRAANILLINIGGLNSEICKNIILAGVKSVTILDSTNVTENDFFTNILIERSALGKNRSESALSSARELNPLVTVTADKENVDEKPNSYFQNFNVVCATECSTKQLLRINDICREYKVKFFCGDVFGRFGYFFSDLLDEHAYTESFKLGNKSDEREITVKKTSTFVPLRNTLEMGWCRKLTKKQLQRVDPALFLSKVLIAFKDKKNRDPDFISKSEEEQYLKELKIKVLEEIGVSSDKVPDEYFSDVFGQLGPTCSIVGGVLSQEIIKAVSLKEEPVRNWFVFNPHTCAGSIFDLPMQT